MAAHQVPRPWDSPGKNTGVGCHFLLQCMKVKSESEVTQSCPTLSYPMDCSPPGSSIHGILQARVLEWGAIAFSDDQPRQLIKEQRHYFANKGLSSQNYSFFQKLCMDVRVALKRKLSTKELMLLNCGVGEDSWESLGQQGDSTSPS